MSNAIKKTPDAVGVYRYVRSVHTPNYPTVDWEINPDVSGVSGVSGIYWKYDGTNVVVEMSQAEKDAVDAALAPVPTPRDQQHFVFEKSVNQGGFVRVLAFVYKPTSTVPLDIQIIGYVDADATGDVRLYNKGTGDILGTLTMSNTSEDAISFPNAISWPEDETILELQAVRTSGAGNKYVYINGMMIEY